MHRDCFSSLVHPGRQDGQVELRHIDAASRSHSAPNMSAPIELGRPIGAPQGDDLRGETINHNPTANEYEPEVPTQPGDAYERDGQRAPVEDASTTPGAQTPHRSADSEMTLTARSSSSAGSSRTPETSSRDQAAKSDKKRSTDEGEGWSYGKVLKVSLRRIDERSLLTPVRPETARVAQPPTPPFARPRVQEPLRSWTRRTR